MPNQFISTIAGDIETYFINDYAVIDEFAATGSLWIAGKNNYGQLGRSDITHRSSPIQTVSGGTNWKLVVGGGYHTAAIKTDGTLWLWGAAGNGILGNGSLAATHQSSPVQTVSAGNNWKLVGSGHYHNAAIKTDGTLWTWGRNNNGTLGNNLGAALASPVQTVAGGTNWKLVAVGRYHNAAIKTNGTLWLWGQNTNGALGDNSVANKSSPVQAVGAGTNWKSAAGGRFHTAAIKTDGTLWAWGLNGNGQIGDNGVTPKSSPVQTIAGGTNWKLVACGFYHTAAIKTDGTLWTWGLNGNGQIGDNGVTPKSSPVQTIAGGTNWKSVAGGGYNTAAVKTDGTLWIWGRNINGQLGDNTVVHRSSPVQTVAGGTNWKLVTNGSYHAGAIHFYDADNLYPK